MHRLQDYHGIVPDELIHRIYQKTSKIYNKHIVHINSTALGGGVAEILNSLVPLMNDVGIDAGWRVLHGNNDFFSITKKFHNSLQGEKINLTEIKKKMYLQNNENFSVFTHLNHECIIVHDPQPLPLCNFYQKKQPWVWRCHIDLSNPNRALWEFLKRYILKYDMVIVSHEDYKKPDLPVEQRIIHPAIDPLTPKNMELTRKDIDKTLRKFHIPTDKPLMTQISRFDKWKDPLGVVDVFKKVKSEVDCRLILCGNMAADDPEGMEIYQKVRRQVSKEIKSGDVMLITVENNILVNVLQRVSDVIVQKSKREGFGLTVTEALWKGTPVVASNKGGIPLQVINDVTGYSLDPEDNDAFADKIIELFNDREKAVKFGEKGREHVRENFLMTRLLLDYFHLLDDLF